MQEASTPPAPITLSRAPDSRSVILDDGTWQRVEFKGNGREWFGIWIINICATVLTLGIYSAWAKVRFKKYFYQNTYVGGRSFDYHAKPWAILRARLVVVVLFAITIPLNLWIFPLLIFAALYPLALAWSARFNARNTSWGNARFNFDGGVASAYGTYWVLPLLSVFTLNLAYPLVQRAMHRYFATGHTLGGKRFWFDPKGWPYYRAYLVAFVVAFAGVVIFGAGGAAIATLFGDIQLGGLNFDPEPGQPALTSGFLGWYIGIFAGIQLGYVALSVGLRNVMFNNLQLVTEGGDFRQARVHRLHSTARMWQVAALMISNIVLVIVSLGLLLPWARVRYYRYLAEHTYVRIDGDLSDLLSEIKGDSNALGDAYSDVEGLDMGLGF